METQYYKKVELQIDEKPQGIDIRLNTAEKCVLRICGLPKNLIYNVDGSCKEFIDICYPDINNMVDLNQLHASKQSVDNINESSTDDMEFHYEFEEDSQDAIFSDRDLLVESH